LCHIFFFFAGLVAEFCHSDKTLQMTVCSDATLLDTVTGLLGTANDNQTDDIQSPSGILPTNQSNPFLFDLLSQCKY
jgi:hypothetical protein